MQNVSWPGGDNIYKFIALGGLMAMVLSLIFPSRWAEDAYLQQIDAVSQFRQVTARQKVLNRQLRMITDEMSTLTDRYQSEAVRELSDLAALDEQRMRLFELRLQLSDKQAEVAAAGAKADVQEQVADHYTDKMERYNSMADVGYLFGFAFLLCGVIPWYLKVQKPKDKVILGQAAEFQSEASESSFKPQDEASES